MWFGRDQPGPMILNEWNNGYRFKPGQFVIPNSYLKQYFYTAVAKANHPFYEQSIQKGLETLYQIIDWPQWYRQIVLG